MKRALPALLLLLLAVSCKKDKSILQSGIHNAVNTTGTGSIGGGAQLSPTLGSMAPRIVTAGKTVYISGTNLPTASLGVSVLFNGIAATIQDIQKGGIVVTVPVTTSGDVRVTIGSDTLAGPAFTYIPTPKVTATTPAMVSTGTIVTITGTNLLNSAYATTVSFNNVKAVIQSITATEIKAIVPKTSSSPGNVMITTAPGIDAFGPAFTYTAPELLLPYTGGNLTLTSQAEVDVFVAINKGKPLQITGDLTLNGTTITTVTGLSIINSVSGTIIINCSALNEALFLNTISQAGGFDIKNSGMASLSFNNLTAFSGKLWLSSLPKLNHINFNGLTTVAGVYLHSCPLLSDLSFLSNLRSAGGFDFFRIAATSITIDYVTITGAIDISNCNDLRSVSMKSLTGITGNGWLNLTACPSLASTDLSALTSIAGKLTVYGTKLTDLQGFNSLKNIGSLTVFYNSVLAGLQGLERLTTLTSPALAGSGSSLLSRLNGVYIEGNAKLTSTSGLQNLTAAPVIYLNNNVNLNDFCPLKKPVTALSSSPGYSYTYTRCCDLVGNTAVTVPVPAVTITNNGSYTTTQNAINAVSQCP